MDLSAGFRQFCARSDDRVAARINDDLPLISNEWEDVYGTRPNHLLVTASRCRLTVRYYEYQSTAVNQFLWRKLADA